jgi:hypothetical protein
MACIFLFLSPRIVFAFRKDLNFIFEIFFRIDSKAFHLSLGLNLNIQTNFEKFQI